MEITSARDNVFYSIDISAPGAPTKYDSQGRVLMFRGVSDYGYSEELEDDQNQQSAGKAYPSQWPDQEFEPIDKAMTKLLKANGYDVNGV